MMLTELYYYYANHPGSDSCHPIRIQCLSNQHKNACAAAIISTLNIRHNHRTAHDWAPSLDSPSTNELAGKSTRKAGRPASANAKPPLTRPRRYPWPS